MKIVLKNGRILDPSQNLDLIGHLVIVNDQIRELGEQADISNADETYDCTGLWICPGLVDLHVHLREPGFPHKETIITGTQAAAAGGYTNICCMPNTHPPLDNPALIDFILDRSASPESGGVFVAPIGALTKGMKGEQPSDLAALKKAGVVAVSDDGFPIQDTRVMLQCMEVCQQLDVPVAPHCEDTSLTQGACMNEGPVATMLGLKGMPCAAEEIHVARNCILALETNCPVHILHVSTWRSVELIHQAKHLGAPVTCEVCPHHFALTEEQMKPFHASYKMNPPLRTQTDIDIIRQALADGTIDCISTDHAPHAPYEKEVPFDEAPFGVVGLESAVGVTLTHLTHQGILSPLETIRRLSTRPAEIFRLDAGTLRPGRTPVAQVTVIDPHLGWTFDVNKTFSKGKNSPFHEMKLKGKVLLTFCGGEIYRDAEWERRSERLTLPSKT